MDPLTFAIEALFAVVFGWALWAWWRRPDPLRRDVVLVFSATGGLFVLGLIGLVAGPPPRALSALVIALLLAQPALTLRLAGQLRPIPRWLLGAAGLGWLITVVPLVVAGSGAPRILVLAAVGVFVVSEAIAAGFLAEAARRRAGAGAIRLWIAAAATGLFALAFLALGAGAGAPGGVAGLASELARVIALLAAVGYLVAFVAPGPVRRASQAQTAYAGLRALLDAAIDGPGATWSRLLGLARQATGATGALVVETGDPGRRIAAADGLGEGLDPVLDGAARPPAGVTTIDELAALDGWRDVAAAARAAGAQYAQAITLGGATDAPMLLLASPHRSLFAEDDEELLAALGRQAAGLVEQRRLADELAATVGALRAASQAKSDFLASMSHELRTPLNAIIGFSDLARREAAGSADVTIPLEWVEHIHRGGVHLVELVNDVLDLARVEAGRLDLDREPIEALAVVTEAVAGLRPLADRKGHAVTIEVPAGEHVLADRGRLRQILYNLLSNAIKFTPDGGRIAIDGARRGGEFHLAVVDTGIGIAPADQAAVFDEFHQVGSSAQRSEGTGLGLSLTRRLVEAHAGRIELASTPGQGSRFTAVLPAVDRHAPLAADEATLAATADVAGPAGRSVLVVEDDPSAVRLLRAYLEPEGYAVQVVADGERAMVAAREVPPLAILLDVLLPGIDGWEVLRRLKADPALRAIPVVIVTVVDERDVGLALGAVDYLVKPIDREALLATLRRLTFTTRVQAHPIRILAIDDEAATLDMLEGSLQPAGFEVIRANDGAAGLELARRDRPELVICDLVMPDPDGFAVVGALKADHSTADIPIIILTGHDLSAADKQRLNGKVLGIVTKGADAQPGLHAWLARAGVAGAAP